VQWECFPEQTLDYTKDIKIQTARSWPTSISKTQFTELTKLPEMPAYLDKYTDNTKQNINVLCNGEINYTLKGVHAKVSVIWNYKAPDGTGDTHYSIMRGTKFQTYFVHRAIGSNTGLRENGSRSDRKNRAAIQRNFFKEKCKGLGSDHSGCVQRGA
jgi:hypothetical protein